MAGKDIIKMSVRELKRLKIIQEAIGKHITQKAAASIIGVSERQARRIIRMVRKEGERGIINRSRGRQSNRKKPDKVKKRVLMLYRRKYPDFGPTLATEKLSEMEGININRETLRKWLIDEGIWKKKRKRTAHRQWRQRKECFGEMQQIDGSHHDWLEGRGPELVLMGYIDDATSNVFARFYDYEGTIPAMDSFKRYVRKYGLPQSVYLDRHTTYKSTKKLSEQEELEGIKARSQFERALRELGVEVIHAYSPQAKGRVERLFGVLQDRLIKEIRLRGISTKEEANMFLKGYLPIYNKRFRVFPANSTDVHVKLPGHFNLDGYLCIKTERTVRNDNAIAFRGKLYQIEEDTNGRKVTVQERLNGSMYITSKGASLKFKEITKRPEKEMLAKAPKKRRKLCIPPKNHPWRKWQNKNATLKRSLSA